MKDILFVILAFASLHFFTSCSIQYSPHSTKFSNEAMNSSSQSLEELKSKSNPFFTPFSISVLSDTHRYYSELDDAIEHINRTGTSDFALVTGDLSQQGLLQELLWTKERLDLLNAPYLTVIGNHDALANGAEIYQNMFGPLNYSFEFNNVRFILLNTGTSKSENSSVPDFDWLENELINSGGSQHVVLATHFPINDPQFSAHTQEKFKLLMENYNVKIVLSGHQHQHSYTVDYAGGSVDLLTIGSVSERNYVRLQFNASEIVMEKIGF